MKFAKRGECKFDIPVIWVEYAYDLALKEF